MKSHIFVALMCASFVSIADALEKDSKTFPADGLSVIKIQTDTGDIRSGATEKNQVAVKISDIDPGKCNIVAEIEGETLVLTAEKKPGFVSRESCPARFRVLAPARLSLDAESGTGDFEISDVSGDVSIAGGTGNAELRGISGGLRAELGTGSVRGEAFSKEVKVRNGNGSVELKGLNGSAKVETGTGDVKLQWSQAPLTGRVDAGSGTGDISLVFPSETRLSASLDTFDGAYAPLSINPERGQTPVSRRGDAPLGKRVNEFDSGGDFQVSAHSGTGDIYVRKAK